ncbi:glycosyltransferase involved in cell wall biosynthesis [Motilibacter peucedani]|uniref:Glycosyltransferase involved in cell wall biosynthesis n=1 Tax=Motilibacter peucedani TaxID=598650 RepID=A0A420XL95_9ACTN|nr:glycosyltransferase [Motilibacter peucedani]RKS71304.1 glycosyltransferase involved in cell wall biosynthesis [Motilibacter peucedani]
MTPAAPLRVVHVITTLTTGGAERQLESIVGRTRHQTATICLYGSGTVGDAMVASGQRVEVLGMDGWRKAVAVFRLAARIRRYRPDVVHVHLLAAQLWGIPAARLAGVPVIVSSEHSLMATTIEGRPLSAWLRRLYLALERLTTRTVAVSATTRERLVAWGVRPARIEVVDNGIEFEALRFSSTARASVRAELGLDEQAVVVGAVGRLDAVKRMDRLVRALAPRLRSGDAWLAVAGDGPLRPELEALATELGVADRVLLLGARPDVPAVLSALDLLVSPSRDETFGMAVVEALGSGLPVVYAQCPAIDEAQVQCSWAVELPPGADGDDELLAISGAVDDLLAHGRTRHPAPGRLVERYGIASTVERLDSLYDELRAAAG